MDSILVTGAAGFIGFHVARRLLADGGAVVALDNLNSYYDPNLKKARLAELAPYANFHFEQQDLADRDAIAELFTAHRFDVVIHLAAQAGVRHSLLNPHAYADANLSGFLNVLEGCRHIGCKHLIYASSSSVYGANTRMPLRTSDNTDHPLSLYGATKKANELMAHSYAHLFGLPTTGLRFFTVYGPWGRPDMAMWLFTAAIMDERRSSCSTTAECGATSPTSTMSPRPSSVSSRSRHSQIRNGRATLPSRRQVMRRGGSIMSATVTRWK